MCAIAAALTLGVAGAATPSALAEQNVDQRVSANPDQAAGSTAQKKRKGRAGRIARRHRCKTRKQRRANRCKSERVGKRSKAIGLGKNVGGAGDQYLPFDNGKRVKVTQGNNTNISHGNLYTRFAWDFDVPVGTTVRATGSGVVKESSGGCPPVTTSTRCGGGFGNYVVLRHEDGSCSRYAHLSRLGVTTGQPVGVYAVLGASGNSGYSLGRHLHYQRENCTNRRSIPSAFLDAGVPRANQFVVSQNRPDAPVPSPASAGTTAPAAVIAAPSPGAPTRVITVDNRVTNGGGMREDATPARLTTQPWVFCGRRGCNIGGTERGSGQTYEVAICQTSGERTTNGNDSDPADDGNPSRFESNRYYGVRLADGRFGYVSEVWIQAGDRGGLGLPGC